MVALFSQSLRVHQLKLLPNQKQCLSAKKHDQQSNEKVNSKVATAQNGCSFTSIANTTTVSSAFKVQIMLFNKIIVITFK
ncbi:hypothetical protein VCHA53O466_50266 [Vibrio chagasii]|nr:hypothetical protein VCHA53O466_50266 [Vibrio chagasii]